MSDFKVIEVKQSVLENNDQKAEVILTGPTVTCYPELLTLGISSLSGRVITESDDMLKAIVEKCTSVNRSSVPVQC